MQQLPTVHANPSSPTHPLGSNAKVLLSSVFGPYAQDDEYGSRAMNPMELYHNQVTRTQGPFSLRMFHRSWGLMLIQANIARPLHAARLSRRSTASSRNSARNRYDVDRHHARSSPTCSR